MQRSSRSASLHRGPNGPRRWPGVSSETVLCARCAFASLRGNRGLGRRPNYGFNMVAMAIRTMHFSVNCVSWRWACSAAARITSSVALHSIVADSAHATLCPASLVLVNNCSCHGIALDLAQPSGQLLVLLLENRCCWLRQLLSYWYGSRHLGLCWRLLMRNWRRTLRRRWSP